VNYLCINNVHQGVGMRPWHAYVNSRYVYPRYFENKY